MGVGYLIVMGMLGLAMALAGVPLAVGRIRRNPWYGFRTPKTLASDEVWYLANRYAGRAIVAAGIATFLLALGCIPLVWVLPPGVVEWLGVAILIVPQMYAVFRSFLYLRRL